MDFDQAIACKALKFINLMRGLVKTAVPFGRFVYEGTIVCSQRTHNTHCSCRTLLQALRFCLRGAQRCANAVSQGEGPGSAWQQIYIANREEWLRMFVYMYIYTASEKPTRLLTAEICMQMSN